MSCDRWVLNPSGRLACSPQALVEQASPKTTLDKAYEVVNAGTTEKFGQDASAKVKAASEKKPAATQTSAKTEIQKPWWKFW